MTTDRFLATYRVRSDAAAIAARAQAIAVEQSVEMPLGAIDAPHVLDDIVGKVASIEDRGGGLFDVRIALAVDTVERDAGQLLNMLFGNTSLHDDVVLHDVELPEAMLAAFGGPYHGIGGLRQRVGAKDRALAASALKPQGLSSNGLAQLAHRFARGGLDFIKDDHGLADQRYSRFVERVPACAAAVREASASTGHPTRYVPSLSGDLDAMRRQIDIARAAGVDTVMITPMIAGWCTMQSLVAANRDIAFFAHPAMGGAARIAPPLLIKLFRLLGADAVVFPNYGGRFGYSLRTCALLAEQARAPWGKLYGSVPVPAGGMTLERVPELLDFYGRDAMLLIGGSLLEAREQLVEATAAFVQRVASHKYR
jgi:ribulose-bisphosphate carboxylase large chain